MLEVVNDLPQPSIGHLNGFSPVEEQEASRVTVTVKDIWTNIADCSVLICSFRH